MAAKTKPTEPETFAVDLDGLTVHVRKSIFDDFEFLEDLAALEESPNPLPVINLMRRVFPEEDYTAVKEHARGEDGVVSATAMSTLLFDALKGLDPNS